jgi:hypothetical protein
VLPDVDEWLLQSPTKVLPPVFVFCLLQLLQSELKSCQQRQQQQAAQYESTIAVLQADMAALRDRLDDSQQHTRSAVDHLRSSTALQIEKQAQETEEQLQVCRGGTRAAVLLQLSFCPASHHVCGNISAQHAACGA